MFGLYIEYLKFLSYGYYGLFTFIFLFSIITFIIRFVPGLWYRPVKPVRTNSMQIIIPVVDETEEDFRRVLENIKINILPTDSVLVVQNGPLNNLRKTTLDLDFQYHYTQIAGKRNAILEGMKICNEKSNPITVLVDSDAIWTNKVLDYIDPYFNDPLVGGVTTNQNIPTIRLKTMQANIINRYAGMLERLRNSISFKSQSVLSQIGCLPGRTIAFRTNIILQCLPEFMNDYFLGYKIEFSDDRFLTNKCLEDGYKTVYARDAVVNTTAPLTLKKFWKQQMRWSRGSQINNLRTIPMYIKKGLYYIAFIYSVDMLLPFLWFGILIGLLFKPLHVVDINIFLGAIMTVCSIYISILVKYGIFSQTFNDKKRSFLGILKMATIFIFMTNFFLTPVRVWGFITLLNDLSWGTRFGSYKAENSNSLIKYAFPVLGTLLLINIIIISSLY